MSELFLCSSYSDWNSFRPTFFSNKLKAGWARSSRSGLWRSVGDFSAIPRIYCFFFPPANVTRCQYVSVVLSHNCGHFNHAAGQIASFHLVWGVKRSDCRSDQLASNSWGPELLLHEQNFLSVAFLIRFTDLYLADVGCTNLESSILYTPPKMKRWNKYLFSCSIVPSAGHIWARGQWKQKLQQR